MATKNRGKKTRAAGRRSSAARGARQKKRSAPARKKVTSGAARGAKKRAASAPAKRSAAAAKTGSAASRELTALKAKFQREKSALEKRLTDTVREIGQLRHHEARAAQFERQLKERDETIAQLRVQLNDLRNRELATPDDEEIQPSLALGSRPAPDLDEFDEDVGAEDDDELI